MYGRLHFARQTGATPSDVASASELSAADPLPLRSVTMSPSRSALDFFAHPTRCSVCHSVR
jgi:hypothetical protein